MNSQCVEPSSYTPMVINIAVHVLILFTILTMLFMFYISKVAKNALNSEIRHNLGDAIDNAMNGIDSAVKSNLNNENINYLRSFSPLSENVNVAELGKNLNIRELGKKLNGDFVEKLRQSYEKIDKTVETHNSWLFTNLITVNVGLAIFVTMLVLLLIYQCQQCIPIKHILLENAVTFFFVGIIEFFFFTKIAVKYIPSKPSLIVDSFFNSLEKHL